MPIIIRKAFKFRLNTKAKHEQCLTAYAGGLRFIWNKALAINLSRLREGYGLLWYPEMDFWTKQWKASEDYGFLKDIPSQAIQQKLKDLDKAFKDAFDKTQPLKRIPVFKKKSQCMDSMRFPQGFKVDQANSRVFLPKLGWISYRNSREVVGEVKNVTVSRQGKHWFASFQTEYAVDELQHPSTSIVGIDLGVKRFATLSNGRFYAPLNAFKQMQARLAKLQRQLKHKVKFSQNWKKLQVKIRKLHARIANARQDYLHKISTEISKNHAIVVVEDLKVRNISASAKGDSVNPGKQVKHKSGLNRSILDQGWGMFVDQLSYKQNWLGGQLLKVNPQYTSQTCPCCQHISRHNRQTQADFHCQECGYRNHADIVGAINIVTRGHRALAAS